MSVSYEAYAPRSSSQVARLSRIAALTASPATRATGADVEDETATQRLRQAMTVRADDSDAACTFPEGSNEAEIWNQAFQVNRKMINQLKHTSSLRLALRACINISEEISQRHGDLLRHSSELSAAADRLQEEQITLKQHAKEIGRPLQHYDAVDKIGVLVGVLFKPKATVRGLAKIQVDNEEEFLKLLDQIDHAVEYFSKGGAREDSRNIIASTGTRAQ